VTTPAWKLLDTAEYRARFVKTIGDLVVRNEINTLACLFENLLHTKHAMMSFCNMPAIENQKLATDLIEAEMHRFFTMAKLVAEFVQQMPTVDEEDRGRRAQILVQWEFESGGEINDALRALVNANATPATKRPA
jgi:hypothetical protein